MTATDAEFLQHRFDPGVAGRCLLAVSVVEGECLLERKQMLGAVATGERLLDRLGTGVATVIAQARQHLGVSLAGEDCADDPKTGRAGDVGDAVLTCHHVRNMSKMKVTKFTAADLDQRF